MNIFIKPSPTFCCFVVCATRQFVLSLALCYFGIVFVSPFSIVITSLGEERANLSAAFRTFVRFALVWFCLFPLPLCVWDGLRLCDCSTPWTFLLPFLSFMKKNSSRKIHCLAQSCDLPGYFWPYCVLSVQKTLKINYSSMQKQKNCKQTNQFFLTCSTVALKNSESLVFTFSSGTLGPLTRRFQFAWGTND